jgi:hypothetical protein
LRRVRVGRRPGLPRHRTDRRFRDDIDAAEHRSAASRHRGQRRSHRRRR